MTNFEFGMNQFAGMPEPYPANSSAFTFDYSSYPQLMDANQQLPPAPFNLFNDPFSYQQHPVPPPPPHHASYTSGQQTMGQLPSSSLFSPPSTADYPPSNGSYPWSNTPPSAPAVSSAPTSASPQNLRPNPLTAAPPAQLPPQPHQQQPATASAEDQQLEQELLEMLDEFQPTATDNFYQPYPQMQQPGYYSQQPLPGTGGMYPHTDLTSIPSPYPGSGHDLNEYSPPSSLIKPPPLSYDESITGKSETFPDCFDDDDDLDSKLDPALDNISNADELAEINIRDLNKVLRDQGMTQEQQMEVKQMRRKQKNRVYAKNCRKNKEEKKTTMKSQKELLEGEINDLKTDVDRLRIQRDQYKHSYEMMQGGKDQSR